MRLLFIIDPLDRLGLAGDTSYALMVEASRREHEVWTRDEWKVLDRAAALLAARGVSMVLRCNVCRVGGALAASQGPSGERLLTCDHKQRVLSRAH